MQREIRTANRKLRQQEEEQLKRERLEQEKSNAMIEWMSLKQGFDLVSERRRDITAQMDQLEVRRRASEFSEEEYRKEKVDLIRQLAEVTTVESDVKRRLAELLEVIRK